MFIFARIENEPIAQTVAGHLLKNNVARAWYKIVQQRKSSSSIKTNPSSFSLLGNNFLLLLNSMSKAN
jgi:hypothetical protein